MPEENTFQITIESEQAEGALQRMQSALAMLTQSTIDAGGAFDRMVTSTTASLTQLGIKLDETMAKLQKMSSTQVAIPPVPPAARQTVAEAIPQTPVVPTPQVIQPVQAVAAASTAETQAAVQSTEQLAQADARVTQASAATTQALQQEAVAQQQVTQSTLQAVQAKGQLAQAEQQATAAVQVRPTTPTQAEPIVPVVTEPVVPPTQVAVATTGAEAATQAAQQQTQADAQVAQQVTTTTAVLQQEVVAEQQVAQSALQAAAAKDQLAQAEQRVATAAKATPTTPVEQVAPVAPATPEPVAPVIQEVAPLEPQIAQVDTTQLKEASIEAGKVETQLQGIGATPITANATPLLSTLDQAKLKADETAAAMAKVSQQPIAPKEPWQMTKAEFNKELQQAGPFVAANQATLQNVKTQAEGYLTTRPDDKEFQRIAQQAQAELDKFNHEAVVRNAVQQGKPVPQEVLKDYPQLTQQSEQQATALGKVTEAAQQRNQVLAQTPPAQGGEIVRASEQQAIAVDKVTQSVGERNKAIQQPVPQVPTTPAQVEPTKALPPEPIAPQVVPVTADTTEAEAKFGVLRETAAQPLPPQIVPVDTTKAEADLTRLSATPVTPDTAPAQQAMVSLDQQILKTEQDKERLSATPVTAVATPVTPVTPVVPEVPPIKPQIVAVETTEAQSKIAALKVQEESLGEVAPKPIRVDTAEADVKIAALKAQEATIGEVATQPIRVDTTEAQTKVDTVKESAISIGAVPPQPIRAETTEAQARVDTLKESVAAVGQTPVKPLSVAVDDAQVKQAQTDLQQLQQATQKQYTVHEIRDVGDYGRLAQTPTTTVNSLEEVKRLQDEIHARGRYTVVTEQPQKVAVDTTEATAKVDTLKEGVATLGVTPQPVRVDTAEAQTKVDTVKESVASVGGAVPQPVRVDTAEAQAKVDSLKESVTQPIPPKPVVVDTTEATAKIEALQQRIEQQPLATGGMGQIPPQPPTVAPATPLPEEPAQPPQVIKVDTAQVEAARTELEALHEAEATPAPAQVIPVDSTQVREARTEVDALKTDTQTPVTPTAVPVDTTQVKEARAEIDSLKTGAQAPTPPTVVPVDTTQITSARAEVGTLRADVQAPIVPQVVAVDASQIQTANADMGALKELAQTPIPPQSVVVDISQAEVARTEIDALKTSAQVPIPPTAILVDTAQIEGARAEIDGLKTSTQVPIPPQNIPVDATQIIEARAEVDALKGSVQTPIAPQAVPVDTSQIIAARSEIDTLKTDSQAPVPPVVIPVDATQTRGAQADVAALKESVQTPTPPIAIPVDATQVQAASADVGILKESTQTPVPPQSILVDATQVEAARAETDALRASTQAPVPPTSVLVDTSQIKEARTDIDTLRAGTQTPIPPQSILVDTAQVTEARAEVDALKGSAQAPLAPQVVAVDVSQVKGAQVETEALKASTQAPIPPSVVSVDSSLVKEAQGDVDALKASTQSPISPLVVSADAGQATVAKTKVDEFRADVQAPVPPIVATVDTTQYEGALAKSEAFRESVQTPIPPQVVTAEAPQIEAVQGRVDNLKASAGIPVPPIVVSADDSQLQKVQTSEEAVRAGTQAPVSPMVVPADSTQVEEISTNIGEARANAGTPIPPIVVPADSSSVKKLDADIDAARANTQAPMPPIVAQADSSQTVQAKADQDALRAGAQTPIPAQVLPVDSTQAKEGRADQDALKAGAQAPIPPMVATTDSTQLKEMQADQSAVIAGAQAPIPTMVAATDTSQLKEVGAEQDTIKAKSQEIATPVQVPMTITGDMRQQLTAMGYGLREIEQMNPAQAWEALSGSIAKVGVSSQQTSQQITGMSQSGNAAISTMEQNVSRLETGLERTRGQATTPTAQAQPQVYTVKSEDVKRMQDDLAQSEQKTGQIGLEAGAQGAQGMAGIGTSAATAKQQVAGLNTEMRQTGVRPMQAPVSETFEQMQARVLRETRLAREQREAQQETPITPVTPVTPVRPVAPTAPIQPIEVPQPVGNLSAPATLARATFQQLNAELGDTQKAFNATREAMMGMGYGSKEFQTIAQEAGVTKQGIQQLAGAESQSSAAASSAASAQQEYGNTLESLRGQFPRMVTDLERQARVLGGEIVPETVKYRETLDQTSGRMRQTASAQVMLSDGTSRYVSTVEGANNASKQLENTLARQFQRIIIGVAIWETFRIVSSIIKETVAAMAQYSIEVARFAAVTDQSLGSAIQQYNALRDAAAMRGFTPTEAAPAITEVGRMTKEPAAQQQLMTAGTGLAEFLGQKDPQKTIEAINSGLLAMGQDESHAAQMADMIGAAYNRVKGSSDEFLTAAADAAGISDKIGISFEKTMAILTGGAAASGTSMGTVFQSLNRISEGLDKMPTDKLLTISQGFHTLGVDALDAQGNMRPVGEIIDDLGKRFASLSSSDQEKAIALLFGGERVRGQAYVAAKGILRSYSQGLSEGFEDAAGTVKRGNALIDQAFGQIVKRVGANTQALEQQGNIFGAFAAKIGLGINTMAGSMFGGAEGGRKGAMTTEFGMVQQQLGDPQAAARKIRADFIASLDGLSADVASKAIDEFNSAWSELATTMVMPGTVGMSRASRDQFAQQFTIDNATKQSIVSSAGDLGVKTGQAFLGGLSTALSMFNPNQIMSSLTDSIQKAVDQAKQRATQQAQQQKDRFDLGTPEGKMGWKVSQYAQKLGTVQEEPSPFAGAQEFDATKYSQQQFNQLKEMSYRISMQEIQAEMVKAQLLHASASEIAAIVAKKEEELNLTLVAVQTQKDLEIQQGKEYANLQKAASMWEAERQKRDRAKKEQEQPFAFQRLQNVTPEQFPQLQAMTAYYNAILTKLGSPEKQQPINLMMGEGQDSVFKSITARMTALQMAIEDLNKTEKAQLAGTWNLPSGATAMVPIQSLDIQRWNKEGGGAGGMDINALLALVKSIEEENAKQGKVAQNAGPTGGGEGGAYPPIDAIVKSLKDVPPVAKQPRDIEDIRTTRTVPTPTTPPIERPAGDGRQVWQPMPDIKTSIADIVKWIGTQAVSAPTMTPPVPVTRPSMAGTPTPVAQTAPTAIPPMLQQLGNMLTGVFGRIASIFQPKERPDDAGILPGLRDILKTTRPAGTDAGKTAETEQLRSLSTGITTIVNSLARTSVGVPGKFGLAGGGGVAPELPTPTRTDGDRDISKLVTALQAGQTDTNRRLEIVAGRVDGVQGAVRMTGGMLMIPLVSIFAQSMLANSYLARLVAGGGLPGSTATRATTTQATARPDALMATRPMDITLPLSINQLTSAVRDTATRAPARDRYSAIEDIRANRTPAAESRREIRNVVNVEVAMLPLRAQFTANMTITLNGAVVARAIFPFLYKEMMRVSRGSGTGINYVGTVR